MWRVAGFSGALWWVMEYTKRIHHLNYLRPSILCFKTFAVAHFNCLSGRARVECPGKLQFSFTAPKCPCKGSVPSTNVQGGVFPTSKQFSSYQLGGCLTAWLNLDTVYPESIRFHSLRLSPTRLPPPHFRGQGKSRLSCVLLTGWLLIRCSLVWLVWWNNSRELKETFYLVDHWFILKGYN